MRFAILVDQPANGPAGRIIDPGYAARANRDEGLLRGLQWSGENTAERQPGCECYNSMGFFHNVCLQRHRKKMVYRLFPTYIGDGNSA